MSLGQLSDSLNENIDENNNKIHPKRSHNSYQVNREFKDASTQTCDYNSSDRLNSIHINFNFCDIRNLICVFIDLFKQFDSVRYRIFSVIIYLILRLVNIKFSDYKQILFELELLSNFNLQILNIIAILNL